MGKITYNRGTTFSITHIYQKNGVPSSAGLELLFTVKQATDADSTDATALIKKNISMSGSENVITIDPGDVDDSWSDGDYIYDLKVVESWGPPPVIYPADSGTFTLDVTATNRISNI